MYKIHIFYRKIFYLSRKFSSYKVRYFVQATIKTKLNNKKTMFRHQGKTRTLEHNKKIASLLSFVAGMVNVAGFLSVQRLTTNVTGHFAFFVDEVFKLHFSESFIYFLYILFFFLGSFVSNLLVEIITRKNERYIYVIPTIIESIILFTIGLIGHNLIAKNANFIALSLLFAMGLQNSLVTRISGAIVRTTHLTGLFTDLGIELSQLFFYKAKEKQAPPTPRKWPSAPIL